MILLAQTELNALGEEEGPLPCFMRCPAHPQVPSIFTWPAGLLQKRPKLDPDTLCEDPSTVLPFLCTYGKSQPLDLPATSASPTHLTLISEAWDSFNQSSLEEKLDGI